MTIGDIREDLETILAILEDIENVRMNDGVGVAEEFGEAKLSLLKAAQNIVSNLEGESDD